DSGWYAGHSHYVLAYSLLSPPLGALIGVRLAMVSSVLAACLLFGLIAARAFPTAAARAAALVFAFGLCAELLSGRVPYDLGLAIGLGSVLALMAGRPLAALALAPLTSLASPVAGAFLALVYLSWALALVRPAAVDTIRREGDPTGPAPVVTPPSRPRVRTGYATGPRLWPLALAATALAPIAALSLGFPEGGHEPFAPSSFWPAFGAVVAIALVLPRGPLSARAHRALRIGFGLYALALITSFSIETPMGGNAARLGPELAPAILTGILWERKRLALCLVAPVLVYWQLNTPIGDLSEIDGQRSANAAYYAPLLAELRGLTSAQAAGAVRPGLAADGLRGGRVHAGRPAHAHASPGSPAGPTIVEVPLTAAHMEAAYVAGHDDIELARGWDRQLDTRYGALFYAQTLTAGAYEAWLRENKVAYVAMADAEPDYSARQEVALIAGGLPYLREIWRSRHWRLFLLIG
ncbi:MAG TPA: hypothetical protein VMG80_02940, partial [Solirubrobacteraceae bacterium]|nr:hypothetical protein [Solirubrobacteraceae bacterium]